MDNPLPRWMLALLLFLAVSCAQAQAPLASATQEDEAKAIADEVADAFWWGDFDALARLHDRYSQPGQLSYGWPRLDAFRGGINRIFQEPKQLPDLYYAELQALTLAWAREHPRSGLAHALHAKALSAQAWSIRGAGFANTVTPQAWADFERLLGQAQKYLADHAAAAQTSTLTHSSLLGMARAGGWSEAQVWAILEDGLRRQPEDFVLYSEALPRMLPRWGGDAATLDRYIRRVVERTKADMGLVMYARLYSMATRQEFEHRLFDESRARWEDLDRGWRDMRRLYPSPTDAHRHAYFACLARDKAVLLELLGEIGDTQYPAHWGRDGQRTFETCKRWARAS